MTAFAILVLMNANVMAQAVGDRVEVDWLRKGTFYKGKIEKVEG